MHNRCHQRGPPEWQENTSRGFAARPARNTRRASVESRRITKVVRRATNADLTKGRGDDNGKNYSRNPDRKAHRA
jgi:hypothetical protein